MWEDPCKVLKPHYRFESCPDYKKTNKMEKESMEKELMEFLKYIKEVHVDDYGHLEICDSGDELDPTVERVVKEYMKSKNK
jgi:hypothetical protein